MINNITIVGNQEAQVAFTTGTPFTKCITNIDGTVIDGAKDLDLVMPMYNLTEHNSNYSETTRSLWCHSKDEAADLNNDIASTNDFKSFKYNAKFLGNTVKDWVNGVLKNPKIAAPLKYLSHFWRSLKMPLINCKVELKLKWGKYCIFLAAGTDTADTDSNNIIFTIKDTKLYVSAVTLSARHNQKLSKLLSKGFKRPVYCNEYKTKTENKKIENK